jgi:hypothetical protein
MLVRLIKPPKIGDSRLCIVISKKTNLNTPDQYKLVDLETYTKLSDNGFVGVSSGLNRFNNPLFGCSLPDGVGVSFYAESDRELDITGVYDVQFLNKFTDSNQEIARIKVLKQHRNIKQAAPKPKRR